MKKFIQIISILVILLLLLFEVSHMVIVIKFGHGHEITIGKSGSFDSTYCKSNPVLNQKSVVKNKSFSSLNGKASESHIGRRIIQVGHQSTGNGYFIPWLFGPRLPIGYPALIKNKPNNSDDYYSKPVNPEFDFHQDSESNYTYQQQILFDIQIITNQSVKSDFVRTEWIGELDQAINLSNVNEQAGSGNRALQQKHGLMNVTLIHQVGYDNVAMQNQNGELNISSAFQVGSMNISIQAQSSIFNNAEVNQSGILNNAKQYQNQELPGSLNKSLTYQGGAYNNSTQKQNGTLNKAILIQSGVGNVSEQNQTGNLNDALIAQTSVGSEAHQSQNSGLSGSNTGNKAAIYQSGGSANYAEQTQDLLSVDILNSAIIHQNGSSDFAKQSQIGGNNYSVISQTGTNNNSSVYQIKL